MATGFSCWNKLMTHGSHPGTPHGILRGGGRASGVPNTTRYDYLSAEIEGWIDGN